MHFHLPKPLHGWREFIGEVGVIVIGVLIALGGEQVVEALHWRHVVSETKESLSGTVEGAYAAMLSRQDLQSCVDRRLAEIGTILDRHDMGKPLGIIGPISMPAAGVAQTYAFDMAIASQAFAHMSIADQARFFQPIGSYRLFEATVKDEREAWQVFGALDRAGSLTSGDWSDVRKAYDRARSLNATLSNNLRSDRPSQWLSPFHGFRTPKQPDYSLRGLSRAQQLCRPSITGRDSAA